MQGQLEPEERMEEETEITLEDTHTRLPHTTHETTTNHVNCYASCQKLLLASSPALFFFRFQIHAVHVLAYRSAFQYQHIHKFCTFAYIKMDPLLQRSQYR